MTGKVREQRRTKYGNNDGQSTGTTTDKVREQRRTKYGRFNIGHPDSHYRISVGSYTGDAGDCQGGNNGSPFTFGADHHNSTGNCAAQYRGAWWYIHCHCSNLNGYQYVGKQDSYADGINWNLWKGYNYSRNYHDVQTCLLNGCSSGRPLRFM